MGGAMLSKSLIQLSVDLAGSVLSLWFCLRQPPSKRFMPAPPCSPQDFCIQCPNLKAGHCRPIPTPKTPGHSQASLAQSLVQSLLLSSGSWCVQSFVYALQESVSQSCGSSEIKSHWPSKSNSLGVLSPFAGSPSLGIYCGP